MLQLKNHESDRFLAQYIAFAPFVFQAALSLRNLGILNELLKNSGPTPRNQLKSRSGLNDYSVNVLLDAGVSIGLLEEDGENYKLTEAGRFIESDPMTRANMNFSQDVCYQGLQKLTESLKNNKPEGLKVFSETKTIYECLTKLPPEAQKSWFEFDHFYSDDSFPRILPHIFTRPTESILDVGGNTGKFALACAQYNPKVHVTILDHKNQLKLAEQNALNAGFSDRVHFSPMDLLDHTQPFPKGHDTIWMSQFLDCFGPDDICALLTRARDAMSEKSRLYVMETFTDKQKYQTSRFCLDMTSLYFTNMANGVSRMYRSTEFYPLIEKAGLVLSEEMHNVRFGHSLLTITKP